MRPGRDEENPKALHLRVLLPFYAMVNAYRRGINGASIVRSSWTADQVWVDNASARFGFRGRHIAREGGLFVTQYL